MDSLSSSCGAVRRRVAWPHLKQRRGAVLNTVGVGGRTPGAEFTIGGSVNGVFLDVHEGFG